MADAYLQFDILLTNKVTVTFDQGISMATWAHLPFSIIAAQARVANLPYSILVRTADPCYLEFEIVTKGYEWAALAFDQAFALLSTEAQLEFEQSWRQYSYDIANLPFTQAIKGEIETQLQQLQFSVTIAGYGIGVQSCTLDRSGVATVAEVVLRRQSDYNLAQVGDQVRVWWLGTEYHFVVEGKHITNQVDQGIVDTTYNLTCTSRTMQLFEQINPELVASRITGAYPDGTMASELLDYVMDGIGSWSLGVNDFPIGAIDFEDQERISVLRQIFPGGNILDQEWVLNTTPDGTLTIDRFFGGIDPDLLGALTPDKVVNCKSKSLTPTEGLLYTSVRILNYNQTDATQGLTIEIIDNGDGTGEIRGYSVPWSDNLYLDHSALSGLVIEAQGVTTAEITDDQVEFQAGAGNLTRPVYSGLSIDWLDNESLDPVTAAESGALTTTGGDGDSVASIIYITKYHLWTYSNDRGDVAQVTLEYV